jgi:hypothetical protein
MKTDKLIDSIGWGLFFILIGGLFLAQNQGWMNSGWWAYFAIGLGCIFVIGFFLRYFIGNNKEKSFGSLIIGLALAYIGVAFLQGFGDWWPLAFLFIGVGYLVKALAGSKSQSTIAR